MAERLMVEVVEEVFFPVEPENDIIAPEEAVALAEEWHPWAQTLATRGKDGRITDAPRVSIHRRMENGVCTGFSVAKETVHLPVKP